MGVSGLVRFLVAAIAAGGTLTLPAAAGATTTPTLTLTAGGAIGTVVSGGDQLSAVGDTTVSVGVSHLSGGDATVVAGPDAALPTAVQLPPYIRSGTYPRAVLAVVPTQGQALDPGASDFEFGGVFRLDAVSSGRTEDNGDNLWQRGLSTEASMFKLELDHGHPACTVKGAAGQVIVRSTTTVTPDTWYRARCVRAGSQVTVEVSPYGGTGEPLRTSGSGATGMLSFAAGRPASLGGKLLASGDIVPGTDQFNGAVAQVWASATGTASPPDLAPTAVFTPTTQDLTAGFDATASSDPDGTVTGYAWTFGDGGTGSGATTSHTYAAAGSYPVTLTVTDDQGVTATATATVTVTLTADTTPPTTVTGLGATATSGTAVTVGWSQATDDVGVSGYRVYRDGTLVGTVGSSTTTYGDTGLTAGRTYSYTVAAYDAAGNAGTQSSPAAVTTPVPVDTVKPSSPSGLTAVVSGASVSLGWTASTDNVGVASYAVYRNGTVVGSTTSTGWTDPAPPQGVSLSYAVRARDAAGNLSGASSYVTLKVPDRAAPTAPGGLRATPGARQVALAWTASSDNVAVTSYDVYRGTTRLARLAGTARSYVSTGLTTGSSSTYTVYAVDAAGNRSSGAVVTARAG